MKYLRHILLLLTLCFVTKIAEAQFIPINGSINNGGNNFSSSISRNNNNNNNQRNNHFENNSDTSAIEDNQPKGIDYDHVEESDSSLTAGVFIFHPSFRNSKIEAFWRPTFEATGIAYADPLTNVFTPYYLTTGGYGHHQQSLWAGPVSNQVYGVDMGASFFTPDVDMGYGPTIRTINLFQTRRPYTTLGYGSSLNKDYQFSATHTQNITKRWNVSVDYSLIKRDGVITRSGINNRYFDITTNYYSKDSRYQLQAFFLRRNINQQENGGIADDNQFLNSGQQNLAGIPVKLYNANSSKKSTDIVVHQSYNLVRQFEKIKPIKVPIYYDSISEREIRTDSSTIVIKDTLHIKTDSIAGYDTLRIHDPHTLNAGIIGLDLVYSNLTRTFSNPDFTLNDGTPAPIFDSLRYSDFSADIYWTNDAYMDYRWNNPVKLNIGIRPHVYSSLDGGKNSTASTYAQARIAISKISLNGEVEYELQHNDHLINGNINIPIKNSHIAIGVSHTLSTPWDIYTRALTTTDAQTSSTKLSADYYLHTGNDSSSFKTDWTVHISASKIGNNMWLDSNLTAIVLNADANLLQSRIQGKITWGWFHYDMQHYIQYSSDQDIIRCPLFSSKNSVYADMNLFHGALHMQAGFDLRYHTRYYADAYDPRNGIFYRQDEVEIGNHPWIDAFVSLRIKQAVIYLRATHLNYFLGKQRNTFILPHYPGEDLGVYFGLKWQFFN